MSDISNLTKICSIALGLSSGWILGDIVLIMAERYGIIMGIFTISLVTLFFL
jgi:hypothetical protein